MELMVGKYLLLLPKMLLKKMFLDQPLYPSFIPHTAHTMSTSEARPKKLKYKLSKIILHPQK